MRVLDDTRRRKGNKKLGQERKYEKPFYIGKAIEDNDTNKQGKQSPRKVKNWTFFGICSDLLM